MGGGKGPRVISMPSFPNLFHRARVRYKPLDNTFEMEDHTIIPTYAHEETPNEKFVGPPKYPLDVASGELDMAKTNRDSSSTLNHIDEDVTEEELKTLRRVSDKIPLSAW